MHKHCFINFAFIFCHENCVFYVTMKNSGKVTQALLSLKLYWNMEKNILYEKMCLHTFICLLMAYRYMCVMCFIRKASFMFNFS